MILAPAGDQTFGRQGLDERPNSLAAGGEILRPMIELKAAGPSGRHAPAKAAALVEHGHRSSGVAEPACGGKPSHSGADDGPMVTHGSIFQFVLPTCA